VDDSRVRQRIKEAILETGREAGTKHTLHAHKPLKKPSLDRCNSTTSAGLAFQVFTYFTAVLFAVNFGKKPNGHPTTLPAQGRKVQAPAYRVSPASKNAILPRWR